MYYNMNLVALFNFPHHHVNLNWRRFHIPRHQKEGRRCFLDVHMSILFIIMLYWRDGLHHSLIWHDAPGWTARLMIYLLRQPTGGLRTWAFGGVSACHVCIFAFCWLRSGNCQDLVSGVSLLSKHPVQTLSTWSLTKICSSQVPTKLQLWWANISLRITVSLLPLPPCTCRVIFGTSGPN